MANRNSNYIKIGFWNTPRNEYPNFPDVMDCVDDEWDESERQFIIFYLSEGETCARYRGSSRCRICGSLNGSTERTDGRYLWPEGYAHYISEHGVKPPQGFVEWVKRKIKARDK